MQNNMLVALCIENTRYKKKFFTQQSIQNNCLNKRTYMISIFDWNITAKYVEYNAIR